MCQCELGENKIYIGQTTGSLKHRIGQHTTSKGCVKFRNALKKYGKDNFIWSELKECETKEALDYWEIFYIKFFNNVKCGYNLQSGGAGGKHSEETLAKMRKPKSAEHCANVSAASLGKPKSVKHRASMRRATLGKVLSVEHCKNISKSLMGHTRNLGRKLSEEHRRKIGEAGKGRKHSDTTKQKISKAYLVRSSLKKLNDVEASGKVQGSYKKKTLIKETNELL